MWRFHKYYIKELVLNLSLTFVMLFGISLLALVARGISRSQGLDLVIALWITVLWTVDLVPDLLSISLLVGTIFTFGRAAADNEITALRMTGVSPLRLMGAVLFVGAATASLNSWLLHDLIPIVHYYKYRPVADLGKQFLMNQRPTNNRIQLSRLSMIWEREEKGRFLDVKFKATQGDLRYDGAAREVWFDEVAGGRFLLMNLRKVRAQVYDAKAEDATSRFEVDAIQLSFDLAELVEKNKRSEDVKDLSSAQIVSELERGASDRPAVGRWRAWLRGAQSLSALLFALVAFPIGVLARRAGRMAAFAISFAPLGLYYGLTHLSPWIATQAGTHWPVLVPDIALFLTSQVLIRRVFRR